MVPEHQDICHDQSANRDHLQENMKTLLDLSIKWNSLEGVKQVLADMEAGIKQVSKVNKEELRQVSPFYRL